MIGIYYILVVFKKIGIIYLEACFDLDMKSLKGLWTKAQWERELIDQKRICLGAMEIETKKLFGICTAWLILNEIHLNPYFAFKKVDLWEKKLEVSGGPLQKVTM